MKLLIFLFFIAIMAKLAYYFSFRYLNRDKKRKDAKQKAFIVAMVIALILISLLVVAMYRGSRAPDLQCGTYHATTSYPPAELKTAMDYFAQGNYDYDTGDCGKAIDDYTMAISLNPNYPQAYNNRAYTFMRMRNYAQALPDLDQAIILNPNYIQALMNRGDIHNYYFEIDRQQAVADYEKVISLGGARGTSVCGHLFLARHDGWNLGTIIGIPTDIFSCH